MESMEDGFADSEEELRAANEVLKLRLEVEHGMLAYRATGISPEVENRWLNYIIEHEQLYKTCNRIPLYDFIGRPAFRPIEDLTADEVIPELLRLRAIMESCGIRLDTMSFYEPEVLYRFVTTELFEVEIDDIRIPNMITHFTYEDYHMSSQQEIYQLCKSLLRSVYAHEWRPEYDAVWFATQINVNGTHQEFEAVSNAIRTFQQKYSLLEVEEIVPSQVNVDEGGGRASFRAAFSWRSQLHSQGEPALNSGEFLASLEKDADSGFWFVIGIEMPL